MKRGGPTVIHVSTKTAEVDPVYFPDIEVIGDIANAVWQMKEDIVPNGGWKFDHMLAYRQAEVDHTQPLSQRSEEHTSELQSLMRISYAVFCLQKKIYSH